MTHERSPTWRTAWRGERGERGERGSVARQVVLRGVRGEGVSVLVVRVVAAVVGGRLARQRDAGVVVRVDGLAEVDGVLELLLQHLAARVARQLEQEEAGVRLGQEVVRRVVLVQHLVGGWGGGGGNHNTGLL